jgi:EmrB/QacA subfamily drug resistance transporter
VKSSRLVLFLVTVATVLLVVDVTIVSVGLPQVQEDLGGSLAGLQWVIVAYALTFGAFLQTAGSVSDRIGRRPVFLGGIALFTLSSVACGLSVNVVMLDGFRGLQGVGAAMLMANALPLLAQTYEGQERNMAIAVWGSSLGACAAIAPLFGGLLLDVADWRWMFLVNVPIGIAAYLIASAKLPKVPPAHTVKQIDWYGAAAQIVMWALINLAVTRGGEQGWLAVTTLVEFGVAAVLLVVFVAIERRASTPVLDLSLFRIPTFVGAAVISFLSRVVTVGSSVYFVLYFQVALDMSPLESGLMLLPIFVPQLTMGMVAGKLQAKFHASHIIAVGFGTLAIGGALMASEFEVGASAWSLLPGMLVWGVGSGIASSPLMSIAVNTVPPARAGMASGMAQSMVPIGSAVGIAVLGVVFKARLGDSMSEAAAVPSQMRGKVVDAAAEGDLDKVRELLPGGSGTAVGGAIDRAYASAAGLVMTWATGVAVVTAILALVLVRQRDLAPAKAKPEPAAEAVDAS